MAEIYGQALIRTLELADPAAVERMLADELIAHLLALHGIHPESVETRLARVIDELRAAVSDQGGTVELDRLDDTVAVVRVALGGRASRSADIEHTVRRAVMTAVPELANVHDRARRSLERDGVRAAGRADAHRHVPTPAMTDALGRVIRRARRSGPVGERCDLCAVDLPDQHRHLLDTDRREIKCVCQACSLLFQREAASDGHYRLVPRRRLRLPEVPTEGLGVPVGLAFFVRRSGGTVDAHYPSPAGPDPVGGRPGRVARRRGVLPAAGRPDARGRSAPGEHDPRTTRALARADRRLLRARRHRAAGVARPVRRHPGLAGDRSVLRRLGEHRR